MNCKICGKRSQGEYCFQHKPRKRLSSSKLKKKPIEIDREEIEKMWSFFLGIWKRRSHRSEVSNTPIYGEPKTIYFHHILPKQKYPELMYVEDNIIILTFAEHTNVESDMYRYEEINKKREILKERYNII